MTVEHTPQQQLDALLPSNAYSRRNREARVLRHFSDAQPSDPRMFVLPLLIKYLEHVIAGQGDATYNYTDCERCPLALYFGARVGPETIEIDYGEMPRVKMLIPPVWDDIMVARPQTYSAALARAQFVEANGGDYTHG